VEEFIKKYRLATTDSSKVNALSWAAFHSAYSNPEQGVRYGREAVLIAIQSKDERQLADVYNSMGLCFDAWGMGDSSEHYYRQSIAILQKMGLSCEVANALGNIGNLQRKNNRITEALKTYTEVMTMQEHCEDKRYVGATLHSMGACYNAMRDFDKSIHYFDKAYEAGAQYNDSTLMCNAHYGAANAYLMMGQLDKARQKYLLSLKCYEDLGNSYQVAYAYEGLSQLAGREEKIDSALMYCNEAMKIYEGIGSVLDKLYILELTSGHQISGKRYGDAKKTLLKAVSLLRANDGPQEQRLMQALAEVEAELGNYKQAYTYQLRADFLSDSLKMDEEKSELERLANKYETDKRDRQIELEQSQKKILQADHDKQKQQKYFFLAGFILLSLIVAGLIHQYVQKQRTARLLEEQNKRIEEEKLRAERSEKVKQQFVANMSHEIRTPVNAINGLSRLLLKKQHDDQTTTYIRAIHHSGENLLVVLNDILDLSRMEAGKLSVQNIPFELRAEVDALVPIFSQLAKEKNLSFHLKYDENLPKWISGDPTRWVQIIQNLVSNAIKFTAEGSVTLSLRMLPNKKIQMIVRDTGVGIPASQQQRIFEDFVQADNHHSRVHGGSGLGLAITKRLVELLDGNIAVKSEHEKGSEFTVVLPLIEASLPLAQEETVQCSVVSLHIIVAEDNEYNYWVTQGTLQAYFPKATLYRASNGYEVLSLLAEDDYDLILMDIQMPQLDGLETTKQIRASNNPIPIIGLTASVIKEEVDQCLQVGMNDYVMKPFKETELISVLNMVLQLKGSSSHVTRNEKNDALKIDEYKRAIPEKLAAISAAIEVNDKRTAAQAIHNLRPLLLRLGFSHLEQTLIEVECADELNETKKAKWKTLLSEIELGLKEMP
jgi:signal transduction histidine kinase/CheY-like chemotaxis protein